MATTMMLAAPSTSSSLLVDDSPLPWKTSSFSSSSSSSRSSSVDSVYLTALRRQQHSSASYSHSHLVSSLQSSKHFVEKLTLHDKLEDHDGCVNSVLFSDNGQWIFTGSDDTKVNIYHTLTHELKHSIHTIHTSNIFYAKELASSGDEDDVQADIGWIVTCAADGRVICHHVPTDQNQLIYRHVGRAHRIAILKPQPYHFFSCGEDGKCCLFDLRNQARTMFRQEGESPEHTNSRARSMQSPSMLVNFKSKNTKRNASIYSIGINPIRSWEVALSGEHSAVCLYDTRFPSEPFAYLCPEQYISARAKHITGLKYTYNGEMLVASYNDDDIYSFNIKENMRESLAPKTTDLLPSRLYTQNKASGSEEEEEEEEDEEDMEKVDEEAMEVRDNEQDEQSSSDIGHHQKIDYNVIQGYFQRYSGHKNTDTVKQVGVFGYRSEFVVSGSDCGHIFVWDIYSGKLCKVLHGDHIGAVNCLAAHPSLPILATSGLENNAKIWYPYGEHLPLVEGTSQYMKMQTIIRRNSSGESSSFRERMLNPRSLRRLLFMLTGAVDFNQFLDEEEENDGDGNEEENSSGSRRSREDSETIEQPARRRQRSEASMDQLAAIIPLLRAALARGESESEDDDDDHSDDEDDEEDGNSSSMEDAESIDEDDDEDADMEDIDSDIEDEYDDSDGDEGEEEDEEDDDEDDENDDNDDYNVGSGEFDPTISENEDDDEEERNNESDHEDSQDEESILSDIDVGDNELKDDRDMEDDIFGADQEENIADQDDDIIAIKDIDGDIEK